MSFVNKIKSSNSNHSNRPTSNKALQHISSSPKQASHDAIMKINRWCCTSVNSLSSKFINRDCNSSTNDRSNHSIDKNDNHTNKTCSKPTHSISKIFTHPLKAISSTFTHKTNKSNISSNQTNSQHNRNKEEQPDLPHGQQQKSQHRHNRFFETHNSIFVQSHSSDKQVSAYRRRRKLQKNTDDHKIVGVAINHNGYNNEVEKQRVIKDIRKKYLLKCTNAQYYNNKDDYTRNKDSESDNASLSTTMNATPTRKQGIYRDDQSNNVKCNSIVKNLRMSKQQKSLY